MVQPEWFFQLHYTGERASELESGNLPHHSVCNMFQDDLRELRVCPVKTESITQVGSTVGLTRTWDPKSQVHHKRYLKVVAIQNSDTHIMDVMNSANIGLITYTEIDKQRTSIIAGDIPMLEVALPCKRPRHSASPPGPGSDEISPKRSRLESWPSVLQLEQEIFGSTERSPSVTIVEDLHNTSSSSKQNFINPISLITRVKMEEIPPIITPSLSSPVSPISNKVMAHATTNAGVQSVSPAPEARQATSKSNAIDQFTRRLLKIRRDISAAQTDELEAVQELEKLGVPVPPATTSTAGDLESVADLKTRLHASEAQLQAEEKRRQLAEQRLEDVKRECKSPFVVPALLNAFVQIADLSHASMDRKSRNGENR